MTVRRMKSDKVNKNWADTLQFVRTGGRVVIEHYHRPIADLIPHIDDEIDDARRALAAIRAMTPDEIVELDAFELRRHLIDLEGALSGLLRPMGVAVPATSSPPAEPAPEPAPIGEDEEWERQAEAERRQFEARLKPAPEFGEGYQMAEWPGTGRHYLVHDGERIGYAAKKPFTSRWEAHTSLGSTVPGSGTYGTRRDALVEVALHHQHTTRKPKKRS